MSKQRSREWKSRELSENGQKEGRRKRNPLSSFLHPSENLLCVRVSSTYYSFLDVVYKSWTVIDWKKKKEEKKTWKIFLEKILL